MERRNTYFLSDVHLGARYFDSEREAELRVVRFLDSIKKDARRIYLVGDVLDYWYEYRYVVPRGFVRFFGKIAELSDSGIEIVWLIGNHDIWIFDYLPSELGISVVDGSVETIIDGKKFFITHGDDIDDSSRTFALMRALFRNKFCQKLYSAIHPRWTIPFALGWSRQSRQTDNCGGKQPSPERYISFAKEQIEKGNICDYYIFGHLHIECDKPVGDKSRLIVLGDWIDKFTYAKFDGHSLTMRNFKE